MTRQQAADAAEQSATQRLAAQRALAGAVAEAARRADAEWRLELWLRAPARKGDSNGG